MKTKLKCNVSDLMAFRQSTNHLIYLSTLSRSPQSSVCQFPIWAGYGNWHFRAPAENKGYRIMHNYSDYANYFQQCRV